jgi:hypothetical protein
VRGTAEWQRDTEEQRRDFDEVTEKFLHRGFMELVRGTVTAGVCMICYSNIALKILSSECVKPSKIID